jgi:integration host factor subunit alpha
MISNVTRVGLYDVVYQKLGLSRSASLAMVELVLKEITDSLEKGETLKLSSFGSFIVRKKKQRMGRNPKTGTAATICLFILPQALGVVSFIRLLGVA